MARPPFHTALQEWTRRLEAAGHSTNVRWALHENLCVRLRAGGRFHLLYQLQRPSVGEQEIGQIYELQAGIDDVIVFQHLFSEPAFSLCTLAGDPWECSDEDLHEEWDLYFTVPNSYEYHSEVRGWWEWRWRRLLAMNRLSGIDFVISYRRARRGLRKGIRSK
jgi:hypothetical protein